MQHPSHAARREPEGPPHRARRDRGHPARRSDLGAKARAALTALGTVETIVIHVGGADEAAHHRDRLGKKAMIEAADQDVVAPLAHRVLAAGGILAVTSDHATCVQTGRHGAERVSLVIAGARVPRSGPDQLSERLCAREPVLDTAWTPPGLAPA